MSTARVGAEARMHDAFRADAPKIALAGEHAGKLLRPYFSIFTRQGINLVEYSSTFDSLRENAGYLKVDRASLVIVHGKLPRNEYDSTNCVRKIPGLLKDIELDCGSVYVTDGKIGREERINILSFGYTSVIGVFNKNEIAHEIQLILHDRELDRQAQSTVRTVINIADERLREAA